MALAAMKQQWRAFKHDAPGHRFDNQRRRMETCSHGVRVAGIALGVLLLVGGVVLLFLPGPGLLLIVFGFALLSAHSGPLARVLDRVEPSLRRGWHRITRSWSALPGQAKVGVVVGIAALAGAAGLALWHFIVSPYVIG